MAFRFLRRHRGLLQVLPYRWRCYFAYRISKKRFHRYLKQKVGSVVDVNPGLAPPREVLLTTALMHHREIAAKANRYRFLATGYWTMQGFLQRLEQFGFDLQTAEAVMELGCGGARVIRHLRRIDSIRLVGTDVNRASIEWCQRHVPGIEFHVNGLRPPLRFADDASFDLVLAYSVFTHIPLDLQVPWLEEIRRVLRPGGFFIGTVLGQKMAEKMLEAEDQKRLQQDGHFTLEASDPRASTSTQLAKSWDVFQTREHMLKSFGAVFNVLDYKAAAQASVVLQKP